MAFELNYAKQEDIPTDAAEYTGMFVEKDGKWVLEGVPGLKTQADIDKQQGGLTKERTAHAATKEKLAAWGKLDPAEVNKQLDRIPELEAAGADKLDQAKIDEIVDKRVDGVIATKLAPLQRDLKKRTDELATLTETNVGLSADALTRRREDVLRPLLVSAHVLPEYHEDVMMYASRDLEIPEGGEGFFARDGMSGGMTSGANPKDWLDEMIEKRPRWLPDSQGGGARGSQAGGGGIAGGNPFTKENWSVTAQGQLVRNKGMEYAQKLAKAAGVAVGATGPARKA